MDAVEQALSALLEHFPGLAGKVQVVTAQRIVIDFLPPDEFAEVFAWLAGEGDFSRFHLLCGTDEGENLGMVYVLSNAAQILISVKQIVPKDKPEINSVTPLFPQALLHELELADLFGAVINDLPPGPKFPLPQDWPSGNYPLRKEWKPEYFDRAAMTYRPSPAGEEEPPEEWPEEMPEGTELS